MTAVLPYGIEIEVDLGVGDQSGAGRWDSAKFGVDVWAQSDTALGDWIDVTCDVLELSIVSGASAPDGVITKIDGTTGTVTLKGARYDPWAGLYPVPTLGPDVPVRVLWRHVGDTTWRTAFTGITDAWPYDAVTGQAALPLVDATAQLGNIKMVAQAAPVGDGESISARINRILDTAHWPAAARNIPVSTDVVACVATVLEGAPWDLVLQASDTDLGVAWINRAGSAAFRPLGQLGQFTPAPTNITITDAHTGDPKDICAIDIVRSDPQVVRNAVTIARELPPPDGGTGPVQTASNDASITRYGIKTYDRQDLITNSDAWCATVAGVILQGCAFPAVHPQACTLDMRADPRVGDLLLSTEITQTIDLRRAGVVYPCVIVGYHFDLTRAALTGGLVLADAAAFAAGRWDTAMWDQTKWGA